MIISYYIYANGKKTEPFSDYPCRTRLSDKTWTEKMIQHHKMGLGISVAYLEHAKNNFLAAVIRDLIRIHEYEINLLTVHLKSNFMNVSDVKYINEVFRPTPVSNLFPNNFGLSDAYCDPDFFREINYEHHMHHMDDIKYIQHMIPHHAVAIDMSKVLLKYTKNDFLISICNNIIKNQEAENIHLHDIALSIMASV